MSTLEQDLSELSEALPHLPDEVNGLGQAAHDLEGVAQHLLADVNQGRQEVTSLLNHVRNTVPGLSTVMDGLEQRLHASLDGLDKAWTDDHGHLDEGEHALVESAAQLDTARTELTQELNAAGAKVSQASADGDSVLGRLETVAREGKDKVNQAALSLTDEVARLKTALEKSKAALEEAGEALLDRFNVFRLGADHDADGMIDAVTHRQAQYLIHLEELEKRFSPQLDGLTNALEDRIRDGVREPVALTGENFRIEVARLGADALTRKDEVEKSREGLSEALHNLKAWEPSLESAMKGIDDTMKTLGVS